MLVTDVYYVSEGGRTKREVSPSQVYTPEQIYGRLQSGDFAYLFISKGDLAFAQDPDTHKKLSLHRARDLGANAQSLSDALNGMLDDVKTTAVVVSQHWGGTDSKRMFRVETSRTG
ncbi:hypothetical protein KY360_04050 [Candidatus Woesearchaeota archaeon]|nr:hypothetical protein [Candidatus Woesearchaeota archaeon]